MPDLQPGVVEGLVNSDPLSRIQHQHAPHQILGALRDVGPLARVHLVEMWKTEKNISMITITKNIISSHFWCATFGDFEEEILKSSIYGQDIK